MPEHTCLIGIDGGGSKTKFLCVNECGETLGEAQVGATVYHQDGIEHVIRELRGGLEQVLPQGAHAVICYGMPGYGEIPEEDQAAAAAIAETLAPFPIRFENDVTIGWAGSLALSPGVNIVGGTGSIAYGRDASGTGARSGGWHEFFSDEGSGYWLGRELLTLFSQQSDLRRPRTALYEIVRTGLALRNDSDINCLAKERFAPSRRETAALQRLLLEAARQGDPCALDCYRTASRYLAGILCATIRKLRFPDGNPIPVSYSGGLFQIADLILEPVRLEAAAEMAPVPLDFRSPRLSPCAGGILMAAEAFSPKALPELREILLRGGQ